jgi:SAM-dependent methyltransferase
VGRLARWLRTHLSGPPSRPRGARERAPEDDAADERRRVFTTIYAENGWRCEESRSGPGSTWERTRHLVEVLPALLRELGARSLLDAPCGDFHWMSRVALADVAYVGVDIVPAMIEANRARFGTTGRRFEVADLVRDPLPRADAILCRECLVHLALADAMAALANFRRTGARWLIATTFPATETNGEVATGWWRPLNLERPPFALPPAARLVSERLPEWPDKALGVWALTSP